ncbi:MAG: alpha/beta fold hydrolase [PVC group bacterium]
MKEKVLPEIAALFREEGFAGLAFDYRGFGESEGERPRLFLLDRAADIGHAVSFLVSCPEIDAKRVGLYGLSYGATIAPYVAAFDRRIRAATAVSGSGNGERWLRSLRTAGKWLEFKKRLEEDRIEVSRTGKSRLVPLTEIIPFSDVLSQVHRHIKLLTRVDKNTRLPTYVESSDMWVRM